MTEEEALALAARVLATSDPIRMYPFEFGWLAKRQLSAQARAQGRTLGQGSLIIDRDGTVTVQSSLSTRMLIDQYVEARREGRIVGRKVWPRPDETG